MSVNSTELKFLIPKEPVDQELLRLKRIVADLEEDAIKKDQLLSQLMSRMREYEMGEYGLTEAVNEIKECKKIIRARDREIEKLTDEINALKLDMSLNLEAKEITIEPSPLSYGKFIPIEETKDDVTLHQKETEEKHSCEILEKHESCQCSIPIYPLRYTETLYSTNLQNEKLRTELLEVCRNAMESMSYLQGDHKKCELKNENIIRKLRGHLLKFDNADNKNEELNKNISATLEQRRKKTKKKEENIPQIFNPIDFQFILQLMRSCEICKESSCNNSMMRLMELEIKLLNEILLLKKLLEISHHQTQELEAINFSQEIQMKAMKNHISLFQGKNDERKLLSKLAMKVLQLQFNQAAYLFELKKIKN